MFHFLNHSFQGDNVESEHRQGLNKTFFFSRLPEGKFKHPVIIPFQTFPGSLRQYLRTTGAF